MKASQYGWCYQVSARFNSTYSMTEVCEVFRSRVLFSIYRWQTMESKIAFDVWDVYGMVLANRSKTVNHCTIFVILFCLVGSILPLFRYPVLIPSHFVFFYSSMFPFDIFQRMFSVIYSLKFSLLYPAVWYLIIISHLYSIIPL